MKGQYVGDIGDFERYAIRGALAAEAGLPLAVCWMLTTPDETGRAAGSITSSSPSDTGTWTRMSLTA